MYRLVFENDRAILEVNENMSVAELKKLHSKLSKGIEIKKVDTISDEQMKMLWCIFKDLGELIGYTKEELREELENKYCSEKKIEYFSISPNKRNCASKDIATDFIAWIIDWSIHQGYNLILHIGKGPNNKLETCCEAFGIKLEGAHDALNDIRATKKLYEHLEYIIKSKFDETYNRTLYPRMFERWNAEEEEFLRVTQGTAQSAADRLGRTLQSVLRKAHRMDIKLRVK